MSIVLQEFVWAWKGYEDFAWGLDELHPISGRGDGGFKMGLTLIDALDTIIIMDLKPQYHRVRRWIEEELVFGEQVCGRYG